MASVWAAWAVVGASWDSCSNARADDGGTQMHATPDIWLRQVRVCLMPCHLLYLQTCSLRSQISAAVCSEAAASHAATPK